MLVEKLLKWVMMTTSTLRVRRYSELIHLETFDERFEYLKLEGGIGRTTFGYDRWINQNFYASQAWQSARREVMIRDNGCDLGIEGYEIFSNPIVHHMNPMSVEEIIHNNEVIIDPEYLILTKHSTHNDIHFGVNRSLPKVVTDRRPGDTNLW